MKRILLSAALLGMVSVAIAQPIVQANKFDLASLSLNTKYNYQTGQVVPTDYTGANVYWDFGSLRPGNNVSYTAVSCPGDADCGTFPMANVVVKVDASAKMYYKKSSNAFEQVGEMGASATIFTDPMKLHQFPITYGQTFTDSYASSTPDGTRTGTLSSTVDGYGEIRTPYATFYSEVLRQKIVENATVTTNGQSTQMRITRYYWIMSGLKQYPMTVTITELLGQPEPVAPSYIITYLNFEKPTGIGGNEALAAAIDIYPNPAAQDLNIRSNSLQIEQVSLWNMLGQKVLEQTPGKDRITISLNCAQLSKGIYLAKINTNKGSITKQVAIR